MSALLASPADRFTAAIDRRNGSSAALNRHNPLPVRLSHNGHNWTRTSDPYDVNVVL